MSDSLEEATYSDLSRYPAAIRDGGVAQLALDLARLMDIGDILPRDRAALAQQYRQCMDNLRLQAPGDIKGDLTDELRQRREKRMAAEQE